MTFKRTLRSNTDEAPRQLALARLVTLGSNAKTGLTAGEAATRLARDGANDVPEQKRHPLLLFARKFWGLSAWMLELIAALSFALGKHADFWIAVALLVVNAVLSFFQEQRASAAVAALRSRLRVYPLQLLFVIATAFGCSLIVNDIIKTTFIARYWRDGVRAG